MSLCPRATTTFLVLACLGLVGGTPGAAHTGDERPAKVAVTIENYSFEPDPVTVARGATIVWTNRDEVAHTVVSSDKLFSSSELGTNQSFEFTFKKAGRFTYFCSLHPEMKGKVIVK